MATNLLAGIDTIFYGTIASVITVCVGIPLGMLFIHLYGDRILNLFWK